MPLNRTDEVELLTSLYEGALNPAAWATFLGRLRRRLRADYAGMLVGRSDGSVVGAFEWFEKGFHAPAPKSGWQARIFVSDPQPYRRLRPERVYGLSDFLDTGNIALASYRAGFDDHLYDQRLMRVAEPDGANLWLLALRADGEFAAADAVLLSALAPHLRVALRSLAAFERLQSRLEIADACTERLGTGLVTLDAHGRVLYASRSAQHLLASTSRAEERIAIAAEAFGKRGQTKPHAERLSEIPTIDLLLTSAGRPLPTMPAPAAIGILRHDDTAIREPIDALITLYNLSANEARLVWALCRGSTIAEAAGEIGLTIETARNYSKRVYAKVGARGQADLVRRILTGGAALS
jgi:DNA-binding CsgD family transcriptional regulator